MREVLLADGHGRGGRTGAEGGPRGRRRSAPDLLPPMAMRVRTWCANCGCTGRVVESRGTGVFAQCRYVARAADAAVDRPSTGRAVKRVCHRVLTTGWVWMRRRVVREGRGVGRLARDGIEESLDEMLCRAEPKRGRQRVWLHVPVLVGVRERTVLLCLVTANIQVQFAGKPGIEKAVVVQ